MDDFHFMKTTQSVGKFNNNKSYVDINIAPGHSGRHPPLRARQGVIINDNIEV